MMNDWSNDLLKEGDLVEIMWETGYMASEVPTKLGLVVQCERPPVNSLMVFNVKLMVDGVITSRPRNSLRRLE